MGERLFKLTHGGSSICLTQMRLPSSAVACMLTVSDGRSGGLSKQGIDCQSTPARLSPKPASFSYAQAATAPRSGTRWRCAGWCQEIIGTDRAALLPHYLLIILLWIADPAVCGWHGMPVAPGGATPTPHHHLPHFPTSRERRGKVVREAVGQVALT